MINLLFGVLKTIAGKRYGAVGLRDLAVTAGVIAEGSVDAVLEGRHYNRGVRLHKIVYESLSRVLQILFPQWLETSCPEKLDLHRRYLVLLGSVHETPSQTALEHLMQDATWDKWYKLYTQFKNNMR